MPADSKENVIRERLAQAAQACELDLLGVVSLDVQADYARFQKWLADGKHGAMTWMESHGSVRQDPGKLLPGAKCAIVLGFPYFLGDALADVRAAAKPRIAQYARLRDYHRFLRKRSDDFISRIQKTLGGCEARALIDSAPLLERALAARSVEGFIGKNTCFIHPDKGSFYLLLEVLVTLDLPLDVPAQVDPQRRQNAGGCGSCTRCQTFCPTGALNTDYQIDARKCLSYWTIEHRGPVPEEFWPHFKTYVFGCDICQLACPYNRGTAVSAAALKTKAVEDIDLFAVATMSQLEYEQKFGGTPLTRAKREGLRRNALIAMTVTRDPRLSEALAAVKPGSVLVDTAAQIHRWNATHD